MNKNILLGIVLGLLVVGVAGRLLPHAPNMTPIAAITLLAAFYLPRAWVVVVPLCVLVFSDALLGWYDWRLLVGVYGSFLLIGVGAMVAARYRSLASVVGYVLGAPLLFFLITNAVVWWFSPWYGKDFTGLLYSYELGLPFYRNMLMGDISYTISLLALAILIQRGYYYLRSVRDVRSTVYASAHIQAVNQSQSQKKIS